MIMAITRPRLPRRWKRCVRRGRGIAWWLVFQPHRYTRTRDLLDDFANVLAGVDVLLVAEVYSAGEDPIKGADGRAICRAVRGRGKVEPFSWRRLGRWPAHCARCCARAMWS